SELHGERALAAGHALEIAGVGEHFGERNDGLDDLEAAGERIHPGNVSAAGRHVGGDIAELGRRDRHLNRDDRLQEDWTRLVERLAKGGGGGGLERLL